MDVDEEDTSRTPKKLKTEKPGKLVHAAKAKVRRKTVKFKGPYLKSTSILLIVSLKEL